MPKRVFDTLLCVSALMIGLLLYVFFRPNTYIAMLFDSDTVNSIRVSVSSYSSDFLKYYLPDFLWGLSLNFGFFAIFEPNGRKAFFCCFGAFALGTAWEILQWFGVVNGTGDMLDIIMYLTAGVSAIIIKQKEKQ